MLWAPLCTTFTFLILHDFISSPTHPAPKSAQNVHFPNLVQIQFFSWAPLCAERACPFLILPGYDCMSSSIHPAQKCAQNLHFSDLVWRLFYELPYICNLVRRNLNFSNLVWRQFYELPYLQPVRWNLNFFDYELRYAQFCTQQPKLFWSRLATLLWAPLSANLCAERAAFLILSGYILMSSAKTTP